LESQSIFWSVFSDPANSAGNGITPLEVLLSPLKIIFTSTIGNIEEDDIETAIESVTKLHQSIQNNDPKLLSHLSLSSQPERRNIYSQLWNEVKFLIEKYCVHQQLLPLLEITNSLTSDSNQEHMDVEQTSKAPNSSIVAPANLISKIWDTVPQMMEEAQEINKQEEKTRQSENYTPQNLFPDIDLNSNFTENYKSKKRKYIDTNTPTNIANNNNIQTCDKTNTKNLLSMFNINVQKTMLKRIMPLSVEVDYNK